ncbi:hypothetical protein ACFOD0_13060 [Shewanella intestini]|uniref:DUF3487 family protein n=1 Tax=Shewanella intestini TaxID=2017544 RepID=A0ABS5HZZ1_9GAMM|nr:MULTISPECIES: hypothetical protein [Shewanella]MBR9727354.1 hypothetical protein [Shewanella intestini]MRG35596.1 hypothetical protein [Shewanella sp. XMDDZSB0408]
MNFKQRFMALNINGFRPASLLTSLHPILALIAISIISLATLALLPFLLLFAAIMFLTLSFLGKKLMTKAMNQEQSFKQQPQSERYGHSSVHKGRTFEHNPD